MSEREVKKAGKKEISPIDVYKLLPRTNCKECGEENCMAFATKLVNREVTLDQCPPLLQEKYRDAYNKLWELLKPPVREITIGIGEKAVKIGGKLVMYRHEFTYSNPTAIAIDVTDEMLEEDIVKRVKSTENFSFLYIGKELNLDLIAIRSTSSHSEGFKWAVTKVLEHSELPLVLCSFKPSVIEVGLAAAGGKRPLIYAATKDNWKEMADLALAHNCPLAVFAPGDIGLLRSLTKTLKEYGVEDLVMDIGTYPDEGLADTINNLTMIRRSACKNSDELLGFPIISVPMVAWISHETSPEIASWREAYLASMLITRYTDLLIMHSTEGWTLLPTVIFRQNLYTDPRKPVAVDSGIRVFGQPDENSPFMFTTNFALTYYTVESDLDSGGVDGYLMVVDTEGLSVESAVAGRHLTADKVSESLKELEAEDRVRHRKLIIPGRASRLSGEIEELTGWEVTVGPMDSSAIPKFLQEKWKKGE